MALPIGVTQLGTFKGDKGDKGDTGTISSATAQSVPADEPASVQMTGTPANRGVSFKIPRGLPGVNGLENDEAVATYVRASDSETYAAVSELTVRQGDIAVSARTFGAGFTAFSTAEGNRQSLQAAIFSFPAVNGASRLGRVFIPAGVWEIDRPIVIRSASIQGAGQFATMLKASADFVGDSLITNVESASTSPDGLAHEWGGWSLSDLALHGGWTPSPTATGTRAGIKVVGASSPLPGTFDDQDLNYSIRNVSVTHCSGRGVDLNGRGGAVVDGLRVDFTGKAGLRTTYDSMYSNIVVARSVTEAGIIVGGGSSSFSNCKVFLSGCEVQWAESPTDPTMVDPDGPQTPGWDILAGGVEIVGSTAQNCFGAGFLVKGSKSTISVYADANNRHPAQADDDAYAGVEVLAGGHRNMNILANSSAMQGSFLVGKQARAIKYVSGSYDRISLTYELGHSDHNADMMHPGSSLPGTTSIVANGQELNRPALTGTIPNLLPEPVPIAGGGAGTMWVIDRGWATEAQVVRSTVEPGTDSSMGGRRYTSLTYSANGETPTSGSYNGEVSVGRAGQAQIPILGGRLYIPQVLFRTSAVGSRWRLGLVWQNGTTVLQTNLFTSFEVKSTSPIVVRADRYYNFAGLVAPETATHVRIILRRDIDDAGGTVASWKAGDYVHAGCAMLTLGVSHGAYADSSTPGWYATGNHASGIPA